MTIDAVVAEGDLVVVRYTNAGCNEGDYAGIPGTGLEVTWNGMIIFRIECRRIAETWFESERAGLMP